MSDQITAEIARSVDDFTKRLKSQVMAIYAGDGLWVVSAHSRGLRVQGGDVMSALREFEHKVRKWENTDFLLAQTLGLEAAE
jgi:hypothetical protein